MNTLGTRLPGLGDSGAAAPSEAVARVLLGGVCGALMIFGRGLLASVAAVALAGFTVLAILLAHAFWRFDGAERFAQTNIFFEPGSIGCALLFAAGGHCHRTPDSQVRRGR